MYNGKDPAKAAFLKRMGAELKHYRLQAGLSQEKADDLIADDEGNRDRMSKVERGVSGIDMFDYLRLMWEYRQYAPEHPAVRLAKQLLNKR